MKLYETFRYELVYQSRSISTWFYFLLLLSLSFLMTAVVFIDEPLAGGYFSNAPYIVSKVSLITFFLVGMLTLAPFAGNAAARDLETRMHSLLYSSPIGRQIYLGGRFLAAFVLGAMVIMAIPIGVFFAGLFPIEHPELSGPMNVGSYVSTYFLLLLPNTFIVVAFMFAVAVLSKRGMLSYLIAVITGVVVIASWQILGSQQDNWTLANLTDPLGVTILQELKPLWTANQKNTLLPATQDSTLFNRVLWIALSAGMLFITVVRFKTSTLSPKQNKAEKKRRVAEVSAGGSYQTNHNAAMAIPHVGKSFDWSTRMLQLSTITKESFRLIAFGWGWVALACMFLFVVLTGSIWFSDYYDVPELPVTGNLLATLENIKEHGIWFVIPLLIIYYAGELVWRDRDARLSDIMGAAPVPVWVSFVGKLAGMVFALVVMQLFLILAGILLQATLGYYHFQIGVYVRILLGLRLTDYVLLAVLNFALHVILNQKYVAHLIAVLFYLFRIFGPEFGIESGLWMYSSDPGWSYSDLSGLSPYFKPWLYFKIYWIGWALLLMIITVLIWPRGTEKNIGKRFRYGLSKNNPGIKALAGVAVLLIFIFGGIVFYSTHVLYPHTASFEPLERKAEYEKRYAKYLKSEQPVPTKLKLQVDVYPSEGSADFKGTYVLVNKSESVIDTLFVSTSPGVEYHKLRLTQAVNSEVIDKELNFRMYVLAKPLSAGDSLHLDFHVTYDPQGFPNNGPNTVVVKNGTYFGDAWLPAIGYVSSRQIFDANDRKTYGLDPKSFLEPETESYGLKRIQVETVIGTDNDQLAVAPGILHKRWTENDRSYFQYATGKPLNHKLGFFSSDYKISKAQWRSDSLNVVDISVLHHPDHTHNLDRMAKGVQASLTYLSRNLGRYPHSEIRLLEVPGYTKGLYAYPMNIFYREGFALLKPDEDPRDIDIVFATVAHEVSHQWFGAQVSPAPVKGAAFITETLSWYTAFEIVEESLGHEKLLTLLDMARDDYFSPQERSADPLLQASQNKLIYRKGPLAFYALREYIGKQRVRVGLQNFFNKHSTGEGAKAIPSDLYNEMRNVTPDSLQYLLHDLFATNTFWDLKAEKVGAVQTVSGKWKVTMDVSARKYMVDEMGSESDVEMNDVIQIGIYREGEENEDDSRIYLQQHRIRSGKQTIEVEVTEKPGAAGIDPELLLMDVKRWDNVIDIADLSQ